MPPPAILFDGMIGEPHAGTKMVKLLHISCNCFPLLPRHVVLSWPLCVQECTDMNSEAIMHDMVYESADEEESDYTEYDDTQY
jgi:hypothetical protein